MFGQDLRELRDMTLVGIMSATGVSNSLVSGDRSIIEVGGVSGKAGGLAPVDVSWLKH